MYPLLQISSSQFCLRSHLSRRGLGSTESTPDPICHKGPISSRLVVIRLKHPSIHTRHHAQRLLLTLSRHVRCIIAAGRRKCAVSVRVGNGGRLVVGGTVGAVERVVMCVYASE